MQAHCFKSVSSSASEISAVMGVRSCCLSDCVLQQLCQRSSATASVYPYVLFWLMAKSVSLQVAYFSENPLCFAFVVFSLLVQPYFRHFNKNLLKTIDLGWWNRKFLNANSFLDFGQQKYFILLYSVVNFIRVIICLFSKTCSSDVKGSFWNHLDKKVLLWHHEAPLFLRVHLPTWVQFGTMPARYWPNSLPSVG